MTFKEAQIKTDKQLHDDKEYLKHCLLIKPILGKKQYPDVWWKSDEMLNTVARILDRYGQFKDISEAITFFEKPYNFEDRMKFIVENM